jgi:hypothetical protein
MGAVVRRDGLVTPCQGEIPAVRRGRYAITVLGANDGRGCGEPGADVLLWTFAGNRQLFSTKAVRWPATGRVARFDPAFSTATPNGAAPAVTEFSGEVFDADHRRLPAGTRVDVYAGATRCGVASVRAAGDFLGYILDVVGPDSIDGCARNAPLTFWVDDRQATQTAVNTLDRGARARGNGATFDLTRP